MVKYSALFLEWNTIHTATPNNDAVVSSCSSHWLHHLYLLSITTYNYWKIISRTNAHLGPDEHQYRNGNVAVDGDVI